MEFIFEDEIKPVKKLSESGIKKLNKQLCENEKKKEMVRSNNIVYARPRAPSPVI